MWYSYLWSRRFRIHRYVAAPHGDGLVEILIFCYQPVTRIAGRRICRMKIAKTILNNLKIKIEKWESRYNCRKIWVKFGRSVIFACFLSHQINLPTSNTGEPRSQYKKQNNKFCRRCQRHRWLNYRQRQPHRNSDHFIAGGTADFETEIFPGGDLFTFLLDVLTQLLTCSLF